MYTIDYRRDLNLLDISWTGLFTPQEMTDYAEECRGCWRREGFKEGYRLRIMLSDDQPLPQGTLVVLADAFTDFPASSDSHDHWQRHCENADPPHDDGASYGDLRDAGIRIGLAGGGLNDDRRPCSAAAMRSVSGP